MEVWLRRRRRRFRFSDFQFEAAAATLSGTGSASPRPDRNSWLRGPRGYGVLSLRHFGLVLFIPLSLNPLARGCRRIWRGEVWKYGFGGAVADFVLVISSSRRRPRRSQVPVSYTHL